MTTTSHCGLPLPLTITFDFDAYTARPADIAPPANITLTLKNTRNRRLEKSNGDSLDDTFAYQEDLLAGKNLEGLDVGERLVPYLAYSEEEINLLMTDKALVDATGPLPSYLTQLISEKRMKIAKDEKEKEEKLETERAQKEADKEKVYELGTLLMSNPQTLAASRTAPVPIPPIFLVSLKFKVHFPLHWWKKSILRRVSEDPTKVAVLDRKVSQGTKLHGAEKVQLLDVAKATKEFGAEDASMTYNAWGDASRNLLSAYVSLCPAIDPTVPGSPTHTFASEYSQHIVFFASADDAELTFPVWYPLEKDLREKILFNDITFEDSSWQAKLDACLNAHEFAERNKATRESHANANSSGPSSGSKRGPSDDGNSAAPKQPRGTFGRREDFRGGGGHSREGSAAPQRTPSCIICLGPHRAHDHDTKSTSFRDGAPHFAKLDGCGICTTAAFRGGPKTLCVLYNVVKPCSDHGEDRLHVCSLCGGNHAALTKDATCRRVRDGAFVP
jgi:hypothetical protein